MDGLTRHSRAQAGRQLEAQQLRTRAWLLIMLACALLTLSSVLLFPPLAIAFTALTALSASRWRHYDRAVSALSRRTPRLHRGGNGTRSSRSD